jgi:HAD superfamily hydrolase (TIGR01549 family)
MRQVKKILGVCFDVGEIIVNETREYGAWADWLGVPRHTFSAVFGAVIAQGRDYREAFQYFRPDFDLEVERLRRADAGQAETFSEEDVYSDVRQCLRDLCAIGLKVGLAGNQTRRAEGILRSLKLPVGFIGTSDSWGVSKPDFAFFARAVKEMGSPATQILYVGDRLDNDIRPAQDAGMQTCLVRRGPWGYILKDPAREAKCTFVVDDLTTLPRLIAEHNS